MLCCHGVRGGRVGGRARVFTPSPQSPPLLLQLPKWKMRGEGYIQIKCVITTLTTGRFPKKSHHTTFTLLVLVCHGSAGFKSKLILHVTKSAFKQLKDERCSPLPKPELWMNWMNVPLI